MRISALDALFPGVRQNILAATLLRSDKWWYLAELARHLHTRPSSLQRELASLVRSGLLAQRKEGGRTYFKAETRSPLFPDLRNIFEKTAGLVPILQHILEPFDNKVFCAFIYGSIAKGKERAGSDVDLMVVGNVGLVELSSPLRRAEQQLGRPIHVSSYTREEFRRKVSRGDHFLTRVMNGKVQFVKGTRGDLEAIIGQ